MKTEKEIIQQARCLCEKFINKVESGRARSKVTYAECVSLLRAIDENEQPVQADALRCGCHMDPGAYCEFYEKGRCKCRDPHTVGRPPRISLTERKNNP